MNCLFGSLDRLYVTFVAASVTVLRLSSTIFATDRPSKKTGDNLLFGGLIECNGFDSSKGALINQNTPF